MTVGQEVVEEQEEVVEPAPQEVFGPGYEKALQYERAEVKKLKGELKKRADADEKARLAALDDNARAVEEARAEAKSETAAAYESRIMGLRVQARAAGDFVDADLVASLVDLPSDASDDDIDAALLAVATARPFLVRQQGPALPAMPQGPRGSAAPSSAEGVSAGDRMLRQMLTDSVAKRG